MIIFWSFFFFSIFSFSVLFVCSVSISFSFCFVFIFSAFGGCCFSLGADWVFSSLFCFLNLSCKQTYDSWRLGHVVPDDVVNADIENQALDIFLHGPESAYKNGIGKTFTHTSIPFHTLLKKEQNPQLTKHDAFV